MTCIINNKLLTKLESHLEKAYPEEGVGFLLGNLLADQQRQITQLILLENNWKDGPRNDRFLINPHDFIAAEDQADASGLSLLGVFHSHPDEINLPSEFDRAWAMPWFTYIISTVSLGKAISNRHWKLSEDRSEFFEEPLLIKSGVLVDS